jgi:hypothetical protein
LVSSIALCGASYYRVAWRGSAFGCRAAWGNVIFYYGGPLGTSTAPETTAARGFSKVGFQGWSTMWWPRPFLKRGHGPALYVPLWLSSLLFLTAALISYRPLLRLRCRRAIRIAEARAGLRLPPVGGSG